MNEVTSTAAIWAVNSVLAAGVLVATYTDLRDGKIYNKLTFPCIILGFLLNTVFGGLSGSWQSACGVGVSLLVAVALAFCVGPAFGGGDLKLLAAVGALRGPEFVLWAMFFSALAGGLLVWAPLIRRRIVG